MTPAGTVGMPRRFATGHHVRAQAVMYGAEVPKSPVCNGPVAAFFLSDESDVGHPISAVLPGLERVGKMNGCPTNLDDPKVQEPWHPEVPAIGDVCRRFKYCGAEYPVVFCRTSGLGQTDQASRVVPALNLFFSEIGRPTP